MLTALVVTPLRPSCILRSNGFPPEGINHQEGIVRHLGALLLGLLGVSGLLVTQQGSGGFVALAASAALLLVALAATGTLACKPGTLSPQTVRGTALRRRAWRLAFLPQRDPDARGRCRPRAPGRAPAAA
jgi:hypothetical protein